MIYDNFASQNDKRKMESEIRLLETTNKGLFEEIRQIRSSYDAKMEKLMKDFHIEIYKVRLRLFICSMFELFVILETYVLRFSKTKPAEAVILKPIFKESGEKRRLEKKLQDTNEKLTKEEYLAKQAELERVSVIMMRCCINSCSSVLVSFICYAL